MAILHQIPNKRPTEIQEMHDDLKECFENIGCYLMPHPGEKVAHDPNFTGKLAGNLNTENKCQNI